MTDQPQNESASQLAANDWQLGTAYYPEHWDESRWADDAKVLYEGGVRVVRMMEFAWDKLEPREGEYQFDWMDRALTVFAEAGIKIVLCTPTATPPPWLFAAHPEICRIDDKTNERAHPGSRRVVDCNVPAYIEYTTRIVTAIADHFGDHPNVIGWQIDNEFGCHNTVRSLTDESKQAFQQWCEAKYGSLDALNAAWGTQFWSATYTDWSQIPVPAPSPASHNPGLLLDFRRFSSDAWVKYQRLQIDILRPRIGDRFITHNFMIHFFDLDYFELARDLDFVSYDNYPHGFSGPAECAFNLDLMRGLKRKSFWVIEQQAGAVNWTPFNPGVPPGQVRAWSHQAFGHGANGVVYFRERAVNIGQEQYHSGLLKHDGSPDRGWHESKHTGDDLAKLPYLERPQAPVAIVFDYNDLWALELDPHNRAYSYYQLVLDAYTQLWTQNIPVDIVPRDADLTGYTAVFVPSPVIIDDSHAQNWRGYVENGGNLIVTFRAAFKNDGNTWTDRPFPAGVLGELLQVTVDEQISIPPVPGVGLRNPNETAPDWNDERGGNVVDTAGTRPGIGFAGLSEGLTLPSRSRYKLWAEVLKPNGAQPVMKYADGYYKDEIAMTVAKLGQGSAYFLGAWMDPILPRTLIKALDLEKHGIDAGVRGATVEVIRLKDSADAIHEVRINHTKRTVAIPDFGIE